MIKETLGYKSRNTESLKNNQSSWKAFQLMRLQLAEFNGGILHVILFMVLIREKTVCSKNLLAIWDTFLHRS